MIGNTIWTAIQLFIMPSLALGVVVLNRVNKLSRLLESVEGTATDSVYIADNGKQTAEKEALFSRKFDFNLNVLDLEYDIGLGASRDAIVNALDEKYILIADSDHKYIDGIDRLVSILESREDIGGVAGSVIEPERGRIWQSAKDFYESGPDLVRSADYNQKELQQVNESVFVQFDFIPYPTLYRTECFEDYSWDPEYPLGRAHVDFYVGHWKQTDWVFGICPQVHFVHYPGGNQNYISHRRDDEKYQHAKSHFRQKWGYSSVQPGKGYWYDTKGSLSLVKKAKRVYNERGASTLVKEGTDWISRKIR